VQHKFPKEVGKSGEIGDIESEVTVWQIVRLNLRSRTKLVLKGSGRVFEINE
jgi:hypothetical protein